ncbi:hypothetical protein D3C87_1048770 [compost metagenome]
MSRPSFEVTTLAIKNRIEEFRTLYTRGIDQTLRAGKARQLQLEKAGLGTSFFGEKVDNAIFSRIGSLDTKVYGDLVKNQFQDYNVMSASQAVVEAILRPPAETGLDSAERKRYYFVPKRTIGGESVFGVALESDFKGIESLFVLKTPRDPKDETLAHEAVVGLFSINSLRKTIPNFAFTMGAFGCTAPIIDNNRNVMEWCASDKPQDTPLVYIALENIKPSVTFGSFIRTGSPSDFTNYIIEIMFALDTAHKQIDFTHYDLHIGNILLRDLASLRTIDYKNGYYATTTKVPTIIDFGFAHVKHNGNHYGLFGQEELGVHHNSSYPMFDVYKLLLMTAREVGIDRVTKQYVNKGIFDVCRLMFKFFNTRDDLALIVAEQSPLYYSLPRFDAYLKVTYMDFAQYLLATLPSNLIGSISTTPGPAPLLQCNELACSSVGNALTSIGLRGEKTATDTTQFADLAGYFENTNDTRASQQLNSNFDINTHIPYTLNAAKNNYNNLSKLIGNFKIITIHDKQFNVIANRTFMNSHKNNVKDFAEIVAFSNSSFTVLNGLIGSISEAGQSVNMSQDNTILLNEIIAKMEKARQVIDSGMNSYIQDANSMRTKYYNFATLGNDARGINQALTKWYLEEFPAELKSIMPRKFR